MTVWSRTPGRPPPPEDLPFALIDKGPRGLTLRALNGAARAAGLRPGQSRADAFAIAPGLVAAMAEPERERQALTRLAQWCERWSPAVSLDLSPEGREGLFLDMTGAAHLFGGETVLLAQMQTRLARAGIACRLAVADTAGAAWALARYGEAARTVVPAGGAREALRDLSVAALRLDPDTLALARRLGLKRIGDLYALPRAGLARRFREADGLGLVRRLDQALGQTAEALAPVRPPARYRAWESYADVLTDIDGVAGRLEGLAQALAAQLERDGQGARALVLSGFRTDGEVAALDVRLGAPSRNVEAWLRLFREKGLGRLELGFGIDALMLSAAAVEAMSARQVALQAADQADPGDLSELIDRLCARLGETAVRRPRLRESWLPERSELWVPAQTAGPAEPARAADRPRPALLFHPPEPVDAIAELPDGAPARFTWRRVARRVARAEGPERLAPEWWRPTPREPRTRDYYRVEDDQGVRYWLFREGLYEPRGQGEATPSWWMHGMFP